MIDKWNKLVSITVEQSMHKTKMSSIAIVDSTSQTHTVLVSLHDFDLIDVGFQLELQLDVEERTQNRLTTLGDLSS